MGIRIRSGLAAVAAVALFASCSSDGSAGSTVANQSPSGSSTGSNGDATLINLTAGNTMTIQFENNTDGKWPDSQIYLCAICINAGGKWCHLRPDGTLVPITAGDTSANWSYALSSINGFQLPQPVVGGRLYISMGRPLTLTGVANGVVLPDLCNTSDVNAAIYYEWIEFTLDTLNVFWGNTTQVDQFSFPVTMQTYRNSPSGYTAESRVGITESRESIFTAFEGLAQSEFHSLVKRPYRILAPCKGSFRDGQANGDYMQSYIDRVWTRYRTGALALPHQLGTFSGTVLDDGRLAFTCTMTTNPNVATAGTVYYVPGKPDNNAVFEGSGVLASGNTVELALQASLCAAFNRHVVEEPASWNTASAYYQAAPANYYAKFWHDHSITPYAYGFCYDDVNDQSSVIQTQNPRGLVVGIGW